MISSALIDHGGHPSLSLQLVKTPFLTIVTLSLLIDETPFNLGSFSELSKISLWILILVSFAINFKSSNSSDYNLSDLAKHVLSNFEISDSIILPSHTTFYEIEDGTVERDNERAKNEELYGVALTDEQIERGDLENYGIEIIDEDIYEEEEQFGYEEEPMFEKKFVRFGYRWKYNDDSAEVGFISSVSDPFCGNCSRIRLSTDGKLYTCLFSDIGFDLKPSLDSGDEKLLKDKIIQIWGNRSDQYSQKRFDTKKKKPTKKIEMYAIGG